MDKINKDQISINDFTKLNVVLGTILEASQNVKAKKPADLSKMTIDGDSVKYEDQNGEPLEYKIVENSEIALMAISKVSAEENPILNYVFIIKDKSLAFNADLRSINDNYN